MSSVSNPSRLISLLDTQLPAEMLFEVFKHVPYSHVPAPLWTIPFFVSLWEKLHVKFDTGRVIMMPLTRDNLEYAARLGVTLSGDGVLERKYIDGRTVSDDIYYQIILPTGELQRFCLHSSTTYTYNDTGKTRYGVKTDFCFNTTIPRHQQHTIGSLKMVDGRRTFTSIRHGLQQVWTNDGSKLRIQQMYHHDRVIRVDL